MSAAVEYWVVRDVDTATLRELWPPAQGVNMEGPARIYAVRVPRGGWWVDRWAIFPIEARRFTLPTATAVAKRNTGVVVVAVAMELIRCHHGQLATVCDECNDLPF